MLSLVETLKTDNQENVLGQLRANIVHDFLFELDFKGKHTKPLAKAHARKMHLFFVKKKSGNLFTA